MLKGVSSSQFNKFFCHSLYILDMSGNWLDLSSTSNRYIQTYMKGFLDMSGGNLLLRNNNILVAAGDISLNGRLFVNGDTSMNGRFYLTRDASLQSRLSVKGDVSFNSDVYMRGNVITDPSSATDIKGTFLVENAVNITGVINQSQKTLSGGYIYIPSNVTQQQYDELVNALESVSSVVQVNSAAAGNTAQIGIGGITTQTMGPAWISGNLIVGPNSTIGSSSALAVIDGPGSLYVAKSITAPNGNVNVGNNAYIGGNLMVTSGNVTLTNGNLYLNYGGLFSKGNVSIGKLTSSNYSLDISGNMNVLGDIVSSGCYFSPQYTYTTTTTGTTYFKIGMIGGNFIEHVLTQYANNYTSYLRIIVDCAQQAGLSLAKIPIQIISSVTDTFSSIISNVYVIQPTTATTGTQGELWIAVTVPGEVLGQVIKHSWRSMGATDHSQSSGAGIGTQTSTTMPPTVSTTTPATDNNYNLIATYTPNTTGGSGGSTSFMGQNVGVGIVTPAYKLDVSGTTRFSSDVSMNGNLVVAGVIRSNNLPKFWNYMRLYPGGVTANTYFLLGTIGDWGYNGNGGAISIKGFIGGWTSTSKATVDINISTRGSSSTPNIEGTFYCTSTLSTIIGVADILIYYLNGGGSASTPQFYVYLLTKVTVPHFDLTITGNDQKDTSVVLAEPAQGTPTAPTGGTTVVSSVLSVLDNYTIAGNVGIGTTTPAYKFDVSGNAQFTGDVSMGGSLIVNGNLSVLKMNNQYIVTQTTTNYQLIVSEDISLNGKLFVSGDSSLNGELFVSGNVYAGQPLASGGENTPSTFNATAFHSFVGSTSPGQVNPIMAIYNNYATSSSALNDPTPILALRRGGTSFTNWDAAANFNISRYLNSSGEARTRLDIALSNAVTSNPDTNVMTLLGNGNVGIGTTAPVYTLDVTGTGRLTGQLNALSFNATSDYRIKDDVQSLFDTDVTVDNLNPIRYFNNQAQKLDIGFLAHEVQEHYPYLVNGKKDGEQMQTLNYIGLIGILVKEIQELKSQVKKLSQ